MPYLSHGFEVTDLPVIINNPSDVKDCVWGETKQQRCSMGAMSIRIFISLFIVKKAFAFFHTVPTNPYTALPMLLREIRVSQVDSSIEYGDPYLVVFFRSR
jgi:hypothetical protein